MQPFFDAVLNRAQNILLIRCKLYCFEVDWQELGTCVNFELICSTRTSTSEVHFWNISYCDDLQNLSNPRGPVLTIEDLGYQTPVDGPSADLMSSLERLAKRWDSICPPWLQSNADVVAWGNPGSFGGALRQIEPAHIQLIHHYGGLRILIAQRMNDEQIDVSERFMLATAFKRLEGFLKSRFSEWDNVRSLFGALTDMF